MFLSFFYSVNPIHFSFFLIDLSVHLYEFLSQSIWQNFAKNNYAFGQIFIVLVAEYWQIIKPSYQIDLITLLLLYKIRILSNLNQVPKYHL